MRDRGNGSSLISHEGSGRRIAPKALAKFADPDITPRTGDVTLPQLIKQPEPYLMRWLLRLLPDVEYSRTWKHGSAEADVHLRGTCNRKELTTFWRISGNPLIQQALRNHQFESLGLPRLHVSAKLNPIKTPVIEACMTQCGEAAAGAPHRVNLSFLLILDCSPTTDV